MNSRKPRARRIAADEAHAWARNLRLGNPLAKLVLCMLALYVNGDGECFVSVNQLAEDCELERKTIMSRLAWLETSAKVIKRARQWVDAGGARHNSPAGRPTSDKITLLLDSDGPCQSDGTWDGPDNGPPDGTPDGPERSASGPLAVQVDGPPNPLNLNLKEEVGESARAREPLLSEAATKLADQCLIALGFEPEHPPDGWCGLPYDCEVLLKRGADPPLVVATFANFRGTNKPKSYVLKAVQTTHENQGGSYAKTRRSGEQSDGTGTDWRTRRDAKHEALAELSASVAADKRREGGG